MQAVEIPSHQRDLVPPGRWRGIIRAAGLLSGISALSISCSTSNGVALRCICTDSRGSLLPLLP
jgi:hypothetical protein